ncbi:unnamed protein product [Adineta steineri]|uniref:G-protein coupled receptors family 1 profile domain-containing protein n=2 Tax=Adineta steineri TaxID=433720 RepID=A0A818N1Y6_9BILA|nr:unnamed protein product [Adineta steineri]
MIDAAHIVEITAIVVESINLILAAIYLLPIIFNPRFHNVNNLLTANLCLLTLITATYWIIDYILHGFFAASFRNTVLLRVFFQYWETLVNCLALYGFVTISVNRCFAVVYPQKRFFKKLSWCFISAGIQWMLGFILPIPVFVGTYMVYLQGNPLLVPWLGPYIFFVVLVIPAVVFVISNGIIYFTVRASSRRVHTITENSSGNFSIERLSSRDIRLLKHMVFVFIIYLTGWSPIYIAAAAGLTRGMPDWLYYLLELSAGAFMEGKLLWTLTWIGPYEFFIVLVVPAVIFAISSAIIFFTVRASSRRVHTVAASISGSSTTECLSSRDILLLKHMVFVFIVYLTGWSPVYIAAAAGVTNGMPAWLFYLLELPAGVSYMVLLLDLLWYNHEVRQYLKEKFVRWLHIQ